MGGIRSVRCLFCPHHDDGGVTPSASAGGQIAFEVDNVGRMIEKLRKKGVQVIIEPMSSPVCRLAVDSDPEGNGVILHALKG